MTCHLLEGKVSEERLDSPKVMSNSHWYKWLLLMTFGEGPLEKANSCGAV